MCSFAAEELQLTEKKFGTVPLFAEDCETILMPGNKTACFNKNLWPPIKLAGMVLHAEVKWLHHFCILTTMVTLQNIAQKGTLGPNNNVA